MFVAMVYVCAMVANGQCGEVRSASGFETEQDCYTAIRNLAHELAQHGAQARAAKCIKVEDKSPST